MKPNRDNYVITSAGCWEWQGARNNCGYGRLRVNGRLMTAHRFHYERLHGTVPAGLDLDHLCRNRCCVNPAHLEPVTRRENLRRGRGAKLGIEAAREVRRLRAEGWSEPQLAKRFDVSKSNIHYIVTERIWAEDPISLIEGAQL